MIDFITGTFVEDTNAIFLGVRYILNALTCKRLPHGMFSISVNAVCDVDPRDAVQDTSFFMYLLLFNIIPVRGVCSLNRCSIETVWSYQFLKSTSLQRFFFLPAQSLDLQSRGFAIESHLAPAPGRPFSLTEAKEHNNQRPQPSFNFGCHFFAGKHVKNVDFL